MRFLRAILTRIGAPFRWRQRRLILAAVLLVGSLVLLTTGMAGLLLAKESKPSIVNRGTLDVPSVNGLETSTATPISTPPPSSAPVVRMIIEKIGVDAPVITLGLDENAVPKVPDNPEDVVWYDFSTRPGWGSNAVFSGHVDWTINGVPVTGVFYDLRKIEVGDIIKVRLEDGTEYEYKVTGNVAIPYDDPEALKVMGATPTEMLTIITCGGTWVPQWNNPIGGNYTHRQIVRAERINEEASQPVNRSTGSGRGIPD
jgi:LPXTG-site transpeptidase (sortase) family protein